MAKSLLGTKIECEFISNTIKSQIDPYIPRIARAAMKSKNLTQNDILLLRLGSISAFVKNIMDQIELSEIEGSVGRIDLGGVCSPHKDTCKGCKEEECVLVREFLQSSGV